MKIYILILVSLVFIACSGKKYLVVSKDPSLDIEMYGSYFLFGSGVVSENNLIMAFCDTSTRFAKIFFVNGDDNYSIYDSLDIGVLKRHESFEYGNSVELNNKVDESIVAKFKFPPTIREYGEDILLAWKADTAKMKFVPISTKGIRVKLRK